MAILGVILGLICITTGIVLYFSALNEKEERSPTFYLTCGNVSGTLITFGFLLIITITFLLMG